MKSFLLFVSGAITGSAITYYVLRNITNDHINSEIEEAKKYYKEKYEPKNEEVDQETVGIEEAIEIIKSNGYGEITDQGYDDDEGEITDQGYDDDEFEHLYDSIDNTNDEIPETEVYEIQDEEFAELDDYNTATLYYFKNGYMIDVSTGDDVTEICKDLGAAVMSSVKACSDDDLICCRDDKTKMDYEIYYRDTEFDEEFNKA